MKFRTLLFIILILCAVLISFSACTHHSFNAEWIIGKTSAEIEARYGSFDRLGNECQEDGLLYSANAGYVIIESRTTWHGKTTETLFVVHFNEYGIADRCETAPGNWGG